MMIRERFSNYLIQCSKGNKCIIPRWICFICSLLFVFFIIICVLIWYYLHPNPYTFVSDDEWNYGIVIDLGSSGSRIKIYQWCNRYNIPVQPSPIGKSSYWEAVTIKGITEYKDINEGIMYIDDLIQYAIDKLNSIKVSTDNIPLIIYGTGGLRSISQDESDIIINNIKDLIYEKYNFLVYDNWINIISPKKEAIFDWISTQQSILILDDYMKSFSKFSSVSNGINDNINPYSKNNTIGIIDIGGESIEIAFEPNEDNREYKEDILKDITEFTDDDGDGISNVYFNKQIYKVYSRGFDGYGHNSFIISYQLYVWYTYDLISSNDTCDIYYDPCGLKDSIIQTVYSIYDKPIYFKGGADINECIKAQKTVLNFPQECPYSFCSIEDSSQPSIISQLILGINEFSKIQHSFGINEQPYIQDLYNVFSSTLHTNINNYNEIDLYKLNIINMEVLYVYLLLTEGFGFSERSTQISFNDIILYNKLETSWTLGAMVYIKDTYDL